MRVVKIPGLRLEPQTNFHADEMFVVLSDPAIYEYENTPPESLAWLRNLFVRLESRRSADGDEAWLNWVIRLPNHALIGYVQATVYADGRAAIAYILNSAHWGRGLARRSVQAMITELATHHQAQYFSAVLKRENFRSSGLLKRLGFTPASAKQAISFGCEADEIAYVLECAEDLLE
ncbi:MAG: GNAT family N-acetyltransferase [Rhodocyclaceae bacterium]|nr:GNAT family N-acetyltransferase [Rhodocyclaceae bacterium]MBP6280205.1 GNAT family N-acetyltransferase [Rhodocyclaceae bacterium]